MKLLVALTGLLVLAWVGGCLGDPGAPELPPPPLPLPPPAGLVVSDPAAPAAVSAEGAGEAGAASIAAVVGDSVVYVSLAPGTEPSGVTATVRSFPSGGTMTAAVENGGFDPVAVSATVGDTVEVVVRDASNVVVLEARMVVAMVLSPTVVRTDPPPKKRDVPLNSVMVVVFSEPIDAATLSLTTMYLMTGQTRVAGQLEFTDAEQLTAAFVPDAGLSPGTDYRLEVTQGIADLDGHSLQAPVSVDFTTAPPVASVTINRDTAAVVIGDSVQLSAVARDSAGLELVDRPVTWLSSDSTTASVSSAGLVRGVATGSALIVALAEGKADTAAIVVTVNAGIPTGLVAAVVTWTDVSGVGAWGLVNAPIEYYVAATDANGNGVRDVTLDWAVTAGGGSVAPARNTTTDSICCTTFPQPVAWATHTLGPGEGVHTVTVTANGVPGAPQATLSTRAVHGLVGLDQFSGFYPTEVTVPVGTTVAWIWNDGCCPAEHDVVFEDDPTEPVSSPRKTDPAFHTRTFTTAGTYRYRCTNHSTDFASGEVGLVSVGPPIQPSRIAFTMMGDAFSPGVYVMNADGSAVTRLTMPQGNELHSQPAWSPDGSRIAFVTSGAPTEGIWVMNADGSAAQNAAAPPVLGSLVGSPTWSPDGATIAFHTWHVRYQYNPDAEFNVTRLHSVQADGTGLGQLLSEEDPGRWGGYPTWALDGRMAIMSSHDNRDAIKVMNGDASGQSTVLQWGGCCITELAWSPDHSKIAFTVAYGTPDGNYDYDIYVINADGSGLTRLTTNGTTREEYPSWSPDGTQIAFAKTVGTFDALGGYVVSNMEIYGMNADGSGEVQLTSGPGLKSQPAWSPTLPAAPATGARR